MKTVNHWIGGKTVEGASGNYGPVTDPATGAVTTQVALASSKRSTPRSPPPRTPTPPGARPRSPPAPRSSSATARSSTHTATTSPR